jgi:hypothetical protein
MKKRLQYTWRMNFLDYRRLLIVAGMLPSGKRSEAMDLIFRHGIAALYEWDDLRQDLGEVDALARSFDRKYPAVEKILAEAPADFVPF